MTSGWDVLSDAIKIGVPSLLTGVTAFAIARSSHAHDLEKERRRRKQDLLEQVADTFEVFDTILVSAASDRIENMESEISHRLEGYRLALGNLKRFTARLHMARFFKTGNALNDYLSAAVELEIGIRSQKRVELREAVIKNADAVQQALLDDFTTL
jgi:hypothetical protein